MLFGLAANLRCFLQSVRAEKRGVRDSEKSGSDFFIAPDPSARLLYDSAAQVLRVYVLWRKTILPFVRS